MIRTLIVGGDHAGGTLAIRLKEVDDAVAYLDSDPAVVSLAAEAGVTAHETDITNVRQLRDLGVTGVETVVAATDEDSVNLLVAQLMRTTFDAERVVARVNDPRNCEPFEDAGIETIDAANALASELQTALEPRERRRPRRLDNRA